MLFLPAASTSVDVVWVDFLLPWKMSLIALSDSDGVDDALCLWLLATDGLPAEPRDASASNAARLTDSPSHELMPLSSRASGFSSRAENASYVSNSLSIFFLFQILYEIRHPTPIAKKAPYPDAPRMIALMSSFMSVMAVDRRR